MDSSKGIIAAVIVIALLGIGYFIYNKQTFKPEPFTPPTELLSSPNTQLNNGATISATPGEEISILLSAQNNSGQDGNVLLKDINGKTQVSVKLAGATSSAQPAHIHAGSCPVPGGVKYPLTNVVNGLSETTLDVSIAELKSQLPLAINVHKSPEEIQIYSACGNVR